MVGGETRERVIEKESSGRKMENEKRTRKEAKENESIRKVMN